MKLREKEIVKVFVKEFFSFLSLCQNSGHTGKIKIISVYIKYIYGNINRYVYICVYLFIYIFIFIKFCQISNKNINCIIDCN